MNKIVRIKDWCSYDTLDDIKIEDGETLQIELPDGIIVVKDVVEKTWSESISDMNKALKYGQSQAHIELTVHGLDILVPIAGLKAARVNPPRQKKSQKFIKKSSR